MPAFRDAVVLHLVEISPALQEQQERTLEHCTTPVFWHRTLDDVPDGPAIILANEFFDALPVNQAVKTDQRLARARGSRSMPTASSPSRIAPEPIPLFERLLPAAVRDAPIGAIFEWRADTVALELGRRVARDGGAALVIDYGHAESAAGDTLQAVGRPRLRRSAARARRRRSHRACRFPGAGAARPRAWARRFRAGRAGDVPAPSRHREARRRRSRSMAPPRQARRHRRRARAADRRRPRPAWARCSRRSAFAHPALGALPGFET